MLVVDAQLSDQQVNEFHLVKDFFDRSYGEDFDLRSGKQYAHNYYNVTGHQFFYSPLFREGSLTIRGSFYEGALLNYDIYNQLLLLQHTDRIGRTELFEIISKHMNNKKNNGKGKGI